MSPLSLCVTFELFKRTRHSTLEACLALDHVLVRRAEGAGDRPGAGAGVKASWRQVEHKTGVVAPWA